MNAVVCICSDCGRSDAAAGVSRQNDGRFRCLECYAYRSSRLATKILAETGTRQIPDSILRDFGLGPYAIQVEEPDDDLDDEFDDLNDELDDEFDQPDPDESNEPTPAVSRKPLELQPAHEQLLQETGWLEYVQAHLDAVHYYPWTHFETAWGNAGGLALYWNGVRLAQIATEGTPEIYLVSAIVHEAAHLEGVAHTGTYFPEEYAMEIQRRFLIDAHAVRYGLRGRAQEVETSSAPPASTSDALVQTFPEPPTLSVPEALIDREAFLNDIQQLLWEATAPVVQRRRTFMEWVQGIDPQAEQLARKMALANTADEMLVQRTKLYEHFHQMVQAATSVQLSALEAQARLLEQQLRIVRLQEQIAEHQTLAGTRIQTRYLQEQAGQAGLRTRMQPGNERARVLAEHRQDRLAQAEANQAVLSDFLNEIRRVMASRVGIHEKAVRVREFMSVYGFGEDTLPRDAVWVLNAAERTGRG